MRASGNGSSELLRATELLEQVVAEIIGLSAQMTAPSSFARASHLQNLTDALGVLSILWENDDIETFLSCGVCQDALESKASPETRRLSECQGRRRRGGEQVFRDHARDSLRIRNLDGHCFRPTVEVRISKNMRLISHVDQLC